MLVHSLMSEKYRKNTMLGGWITTHFGGYEPLVPVPLTKKNQTGTGV